MNVRIILDDIDRHGEGCECGDCDALGKSYGAGVYPVGSDDVIERFYSCAEDVAIRRAVQHCLLHGLLLEVPDVAVDS